MAIERNDPYQPNPSNDELLRRRAAQFDNELQADPELAEGPASGGRIAMFAIALVAILGVVFYGLNSSNMTSPEATPTAQTSPSAPAPNSTAQTTRPPAGQTTGSAMRPAQPTSPPATNNPSPSIPQNNNAPAGAPSSN
ncbi:MAG: hypothetical protein V4661_07900 [Pseudomonadota bacterium]